MGTIKFIVIFSALSFMIYGFSSFFSKRMLKEYKRWGQEKNRLFVGYCQLLGACGLIIGYFYPIILFLSSLLLTLMMLKAIFIRIKIKDTIKNTFPAIFYFIINFIIFYMSYKLL
tara:strand:+ start:209 stop:553 length:345 start_codon:yes stop_codon:yes gene_type:complete